jgi:hypothetical protein
MQNLGLMAHSWSPASTAPFCKTHPWSGWKKEHAPAISCVSIARPLGQSGSFSVLPNQVSGSFASGRR